MKVLGQRKVKYEDTGKGGKVIYLWKERYKRKGMKGRDWKEKYEREKD